MGDKTISKLILIMIVLSMVAIAIIIIQHHKDISQTGKNEDDVYIIRYLEDGEMEDDNGAGIREAEEYYNNLVIEEEEE